MKYLTLKPGGILERNVWVPESKSYVSSDISDQALFFLHRQVSIDDITLKDLFLLIDKNIDKLEPIFGDWIDVFTHNALHNEPNPKNDPNSMDYLELSWALGVDDGEINIPEFPNFGGIGICKEKMDGFEIGETIQWGVGFSLVEDMGHLPLKLNNKVSFYVEKNNKIVSQETYTVNDLTLFHLIKGVIWEMSFYGSPEMAKETMEKIQQSVDDIKSGKEVCVPLDDSFWDKLESESEFYSDSGLLNLK